MYENIKKNGVPPSPMGAMYLVMFWLYSYLALSVVYFSYILLEALRRKGGSTTLSSLQQPIVMSLKRESQSTKQHGCMAYQRAPYATEL